MEVIRNTNIEPYISFKKSQQQLMHRNDHILTYTVSSFTCRGSIPHNSDVIMSAIASQITSVEIVCLTVCSAADQRKHQSSASLVCVRGIHRSPVDSPRKGSVTRKIYPFDDVIMGHDGFLAVNVPRHQSVHCHIYGSLGWRGKFDDSAYCTLSGDSYHRALDITKLMLPLHVDGHQQP